MPETLLIIFAKEPAPGQVKTRLCPPLTKNQAADFYAQCLSDIVPIFSGREELDLALAYSPQEAEPYFRNLAPDAPRFPQADGDLGERQTAAFQWGFARGYRRVLIRNSDSPDLPARYVAEAATRLAQGHADAVLGPCPDGGYYLVGLRRAQPTLFSGVAWSTPRTLADLLARVAALGLAVHLLPPWPDLDTWAEVLNFVRRGIAPDGPGRRTFALAAQLARLVSGQDVVKDVKNGP